MGSPLRDGALTAWMRREGEWRRTVYHGCRVVDERAEEAQAVGPKGSSGLTAWLFRPCGLRPGDYVAAGAIDDPEPPRGALAVRSVAPYTLSGVPHHVKVSAR